MGIFKFMRKQRRLALERSQLSAAPAVGHMPKSETKKLPRKTPEQSRERVQQLMDEGWYVRLVQLDTGDTAVLKCRRPFSGNRCPK